MPATRVGPARSTPAESALRFGGRARSARWRGRRPLLLGLSALVLVVGLGALLYAGPVLVLRKVDVAGLSDQRTADVRAAADAPLGRPLARVDAGAVERRVRALPFVAGVRVSRRWPSTLSVVVDARTPAAVVPVGSRFRVVDDAGVAFASAVSPVIGLPVVRVGLDDAHHVELQAAMAVLAALPPQVRGTVSAVTAGSPDDVRLTVGAATVVWGSPDRSDRKAAVFAILRRTPAKVYDLSSPDTPVLR